VEPLERINPAMDLRFLLVEPLSRGSGGPFIVALADGLKASSRQSHKLRYIRFPTELRSAFRVTRHTKLVSPASVCAAIRYNDLANVF
jgi:hypothetical protein